MPDEFDVGWLAEIPDPFAGAPAPRTRPSVDRMAHGRAATRARARALRLLAVGLALAFEAGWLVRHGLHSDAGASSPSSALLGLLVPVVVAVVVFGAAVRAGARGLGEPASRIGVLLVTAPALFALAALVGSPELAKPGDFWAVARPCLGATFVLAGVPFALAAVAFRKAFVAASTWRTAALGVGCGALAAATINLACPDHSALHIIVAHGAALVAGGLVGALLGPRVTRA
jgi:hypothetical protein